MLPVTVVIPTYNGRLFIAQALASVFDQTMPPAEVIVVDDYSNDGTAELAVGIARAAPVPMRVVRLPENSGGPARPINVGIAAAHTELIAVLDQDDTFLPDKLEQQARFLSGHPNVVFAGGLCYCDNQFGELEQRGFKAITSLGGKTAPEFQTLPGQKVLRILILEGNFLLGYPAFMFRKAHWLAKGGVDERLPVASDYDLLCWLCTQGPVALIASRQYMRRVHDANVCNNRQKLFLDLTRVRAKYLVREPCLLADEGLARPMAQWFSAFSYWLREAGNYRAAWECCRLESRVWGWDAGLFLRVCKLPLHGLWCRVAGRHPLYNSWTSISPSTAGTQPVVSTIETQSHQ